jgi:hypothetical protein
LEVALAKGLAHQSQPASRSRAGPSLEEAAGRAISAPRLDPTPIILVGYADSSPALASRRRAGLVD